MTVDVYIPSPALTQSKQNKLDNVIGTVTPVKKVFIATQGCQMNDYDSQRMADLLGESHGFEQVGSPEKADLLLMNTCSIREKAQEKVFSELGRWRKYKEANPDVVIGVGGCVASQEGENIQKRAPFVDMVFGPQTLHRLPDLLDNLDKQKNIKKPAKRIGMVDVSFPDIEKFDFLPEPRVEGVKAFVSIMEGCSKYCSFCVVPYTRGEEVSRPLDDVLAEVAHLAEQGVREINLLGQNVNGYRGQKHDGSVCRFSELLHLVSHIEGIGRIRYTTSHPLEFTDDIIAAYASLPALANHLHLPVQSGSNAVLASMKRNHNIDLYIEQIRKLREIRPDISLASDFIIGFPGESEADFEDTYTLAKDLDFDHSYSFIYSRRPGTPAADLPDDVDLATKKARLAKFQQLIVDSTISKTKAMVGSTQRVLMERTADRAEGCILGTSDNGRTVQVVGDIGLIGKFAKVKVSSYVSHHMVRGELVELEDM